MQFNLPRSVYLESHRQAFYRESLTRIEALPGVRAAALTFAFVAPRFVCAPILVPSVP